jgi:hypothetical protein
MTPEEALSILDKNSYELAGKYRGRKEKAIFNQTFESIEVLSAVLGLTPIQQTAKEAYEQYRAVVHGPNGSSSKGTQLNDLH